MRRRSAEEGGNSGKPIEASTVEIGRYPPLLGESESQPYELSYEYRLK